MMKVVTVVKTDVQEVVLIHVAEIALAVAQTNAMAVAVHVNTVPGINFIPEDLTLSQVLKSTNQLLLIQ